MKKGRNKNRDRNRGYSSAFAVTMLEGMGYVQFSNCEKAYHNRERMARVLDMAYSLRRPISEYIHRAGVRVARPDRQLRQTLCMWFSAYGSSHGSYASARRAYVDSAEIMEGVSREQLIEAAAGRGPFAAVMQDIMGAVTANETDMCCVMDEIRNEAAALLSSPDAFMERMFNAMRSYACGKRRWNISGVRDAYAVQLSQLCRRYVASNLDGIPET